MTNAEKDLLIAYLVDAGDIDPDGDVEAQFLAWYQVQEEVVSGEAHHMAVLEAAQVWDWFSVSDLGLFILDKARWPASQRPSRRLAC